VKVSPKAYGVEGSSVYLEPGQRLTLRALLYGLLLVSGNDAAVELAIAEAGSVPAFVARMNAEAKALGATGTTFENPDGLYLPGHMTTAHDLALITRAALSYPDFRRIDATRTFMFPGQPKPFELMNQNLLLWNYPGAIGVKIGYTVQAKNSIVAAATRHGVTLIAVALHTDVQHNWSDAETLLNWGFANFHPVLVVRPGQALARAPGGAARAVAAAGFAWLAGPGQAAPHVAVHVRWPSAWRAGEPVGMAVVGPKRSPLAVLPLTADGASPPPPPPSHAGLWYLAAGVLALLLLLAWRRRRRRRRRRYRLRFMRVRRRGL